METTCPHCSQAIEIDPVTLQSLHGRSHFACPACEGMVPVPGARAKASSPAGPARGLNRNLLILGTAALLTLGGVVWFIASRKSGDVQKTTRNILNETINNKFFQDLIAAGKVTEQQLRDSIAEIQPAGNGFIGISKTKAPAAEAAALAQRLGAEVLNLNTAAAHPGSLLGWTGAFFPEHSDHPAWVLQGTAFSLIESGERFPVPNESTPRPVFLHWLPGSPKTSN
jgi:hypothetical protein